MRTIACGLVALFIILALGASVETRPPVALADSVGSMPVVLSVSSAGNVKSQTWVQVDRGGESVYTDYRDYTDRYDLIYTEKPSGGQAGWYPTGPTQAFGVGRDIGIWTCVDDPATGYHGCSGQYRFTTSGPCSGCASASPDGQIWWDHHTIHTPRLSGSQWFGQPTSTGAGLQPRKGIGGGG